MERFASSQLLSGFDVPDHHQGNLAGSAAPIARAERRRRGSTLAEIAIWIAAEIAPGRSGCQREPAVGTILLDDRGSLHSDDDEDAAVLDCATAIVGLDLRSADDEEAVVLDFAPALGGLDPRRDDEAVVLDFVISSASPENAGVSKIKFQPAVICNFSPFFLCFRS